MSLFRLREQYVWQLSIPFICYIFFKHYYNYSADFTKEFGNFDHSHSSQKYLKGKKIYQSNMKKNSPFVKNYYDTDYEWKKKERHVGYVTLLED